ncbi:MAG: orotidine-5'-phosphate decarboxylase [Acidobacteria bacterium]|nr:orotidine-5'-phosphate decarboxylase [Acidobacteriota bacterium]
MSPQAKSLSRAPLRSNLPAEARLIVALDVSSSGEARKIVSTLGDSVLIYKVGMQLYTAEGPRIVRDLVESGRRVFLDLKYHDIPTTVGAAVGEAAGLGVSFLTVHAAGGAKMLRAAVEAAGSRSPEATVVRSQQLEILAVTVLTSMDESDLAETGVPAPVADQVIRLTSVALDAGCRGVVSSARESKILRDKFGHEFLIVNPGVRPRGADHGDQARVVTPAEAIALGASHIVVGRPITRAKDPARAAKEIRQEIESGLS